MVNSAMEVTNQIRDQKHFQSLILPFQDYFQHFFLISNKKKIANLILVDKTTHKTSLKPQKPENFIQETVNKTIQKLILISSFNILMQ